MSAGPAGGGGRCPRVPAPPPPGVAGGGRGAARDAAPVPLTRASRRLQVLVQELEQYQVCASRRPPPCPVPSVPPRDLVRGRSPGPAAPRPPPRRPPPRPRTRAVVTRVRPVSLQLLPKRLDWEGNEHNRSYEELVRLLPFLSRCFRAPGPPPPFRGSGSWGAATQPRSQAGGRAAGASPGPWDFPGKVLFCIGVAGFVLVGNGPGGPRGGGGGDSPRRFAVGWLPRCDCSR